MPRTRRLDVNFPEPEAKSNGNKVYTWDTIKVSALYDLRDQLDEQNLLARQILTVLKRMDRRMQASMPLRPRRK